jgi:1-acyl-sn-glycerol-3-phosphate acyltransferase
MPLSPKLARALTRFFAGQETVDRADRTAFNDMGHGFDAFGLHTDYIGLGHAISSPLYDKYFRVLSYNHHHIPETGPAIIACNHSGTLPVDGMMLWADIWRHTEPPRAARAVADYFVPSLPFIGTLFARSGVVGGSRGNARTLLENGEMLMIFPEGVPGIGKNFSERYQLQEWRLGHCELAIRHGAPIVPVGLVGAEEQMPQLFRIPFRGALPHIPVPATLFPLPVRYHIHYGPPIPVHEDYTPDQADDPEVVKEAAQRVKEAVHHLIQEGLKQRKGIFR